MKTSPLLIDIGEWYLVGKNGPDDFVTGGPVPWAGPHYRKYGMADGTPGPPWPTVNDPPFPWLSTAPFLTPSLKAAWPQKMHVSWNVNVSGWINDYGDQKAIDVLTEATKVGEQRINVYTETPYHFLASEGSAFKQPSDCVKSNIAAIPRYGKKIIYDGGFGDEHSYPYPSRLAANPTMMASYPMDGVSLDGADPYTGQLGRMLFVFTKANVTLQMWRNYFAPLQSANLYGCTHNWVRMGLVALGYNNIPGELGLNSGTPTKLWDDWTQIVENCGNQARAMSETGTVKGLLLDNEDFDPGNCFDKDAYPARSYDECYAQARLRGRQVMSAWRNWLPNIEIGILISPAVSVFSKNQVLNDHFQLNGAFFAGMI